MMTKLEHRIDFKLLFSVTNANPNGDPLSGNRPRVTVDGLGEVSDVALKRKIRNRLQDLGAPILIQSLDRIDDGINNIREKVSLNPEIAALPNDYTKSQFSEIATRTWYDVRAFGQVFAFSKKELNKNDQFKSLSVGVRGPVTIQPAFTINPITIDDMQITKSINGEPGEKKGSDTMGLKHSVLFGLYMTNGSINVTGAEKTGFSQEDAELLKRALTTLFLNDESSARPAGSMDVVRLDWWEHEYTPDENEQLPGILSVAKTHSFIEVEPLVESPKSMADYEIIDNTPDFVKHDVYTN